MNKPYRVTWLFIGNEEVLSKTDRVKPFGTRDVMFKDVSTLEEARSLRAELMAISGDLKDRGLYVELAPYIFNKEAGAFG